MTINTNSIASSLLTQLFEDGLSVEDIQSVFDAGHAMVSSLDDAKPPPLIIDEILDSAEIDAENDENPYSELIINGLQPFRLPGVNMYGRRHMQTTLTTMFPTFSHVRAEAFAESYNPGTPIAYGPLHKIKKLRDELIKDRSTTCKISETDIEFVDPEELNLCFLNCTGEDIIF